MYILPLYAILFAWSEALGSFSAVRHELNIDHKVEHGLSDKSVLHQPIYPLQKLLLRNKRTAEKHNNDTGSINSKHAAIPNKDKTAIENKARPMSNEITDTDGDVTGRKGGAPGNYDCPKLCLCDVLKSRLSLEKLFSVDCSGLELIQLPTQIPMGTEVLKLSANRIETASLGSLHQLAQLSQLHLEANHIYTIEKWPLLSTSLHYIVLDSNELDYLPNSSFVEMPNLVYISSSHNKIEVLHQDAFYGLAKLEVLIFTANRISEIDVRWFRHLASLKQLLLGSNNIHTLEDGSFKPLSSLEVLDLSNNHLHAIHVNAFKGLTKLKELYLQQNNIPVVPTVALQTFALCDIIDLSINHIDIIEPYDITDINVTSIKLNAMKNLQLVDVNGFYNMVHLRHLEITDNTNLLYIDRFAFNSLPNLHSLFLYNNGLNTVEMQLVASVPSLRQLDIHSNPLYCDCTLRWLRDKHYLSSKNISLFNTNKTKCDLPGGLSGYNINQDQLSNIPSQCPPRLLPLFRGQYTLALGDPFTISCKATGIPLPTVQWSLPSTHSRKLIKHVEPLKHNVRHGEDLPLDRLAISFIDTTDGGNYTCFSQNIIGQISATAVLIVQKSSAYLIISKLTSTSVTVTWAKTHHSRDYELIYHREISSENITYLSVKIQPYMREYTVSGLHPSTKYFLCIAVSYTGKHIPINCSSVVTRDIHYMDSGLHSTKNVVMTGSIATLLSVVLLICVVGYCSRRYNKNKERQAKLYTDSLSQLYPASLDSISDTTPITYENRIAEMYDFEDSDGLGQVTTSLSSNSLS